LAIASLADNHRVIAPDLPGYGESELPSHGRCTVEYYIAFLTALMDALRIERASLVGISMGGAIALGFALQSPQRVERLVLVDSYGLQRRAPAHVASFVFVHAPLLQSLVWRLMRASRAAVQASLRNLFYDPTAVSPQLVDELWRALQRPDVGRAFSSFQRSELLWAGLRTVYIPRLREITPPTFIVHGEHDSLVPLECARLAHQLIPGSTLCVIPRCGHWPPRERPDEFNRALLNFLALA